VSSVPQSLTPDEIRAAAETHHELGPQYRDAVIESFLDRVGREIDARVDARLAAHQQEGQPPARHKHSGASMSLPVLSLIFGIPISAIAVAAGSHPAGIWGLIVVWAAIAVINVAYAMQARRTGRR
jgi:hypothetical protein